ncbi:L-histidine N(alpha)-methyltransferase [Sandaracinobacteroides hominis]|uniref:L-histidine N(alpha)-methyltransferase n=1 Tax=Sandaracinobacteroides hominis TaxID=2780086 RepID=UPI0018F462EE|nr:L-histidine N(alpha)-methyltransferase [Sandaracinobacteroides hominis]
MRFGHATGVSGRFQAEVDPAFRFDVLQGLSQTQKAVPARWLYDLAGSRLFEEITQLADYYPTRVETALLKQHGAEIGRLAGKASAVVEFGSGSSTKTPLLLRELQPAIYVPIDISGEFLRQSGAQLSAQFPELTILPVQADFTRPVQLPPALRGHPTLGFFPGSTIGNLIPWSAIDLLRSMRETLGDGAQLLIGMDRVKDIGRLVRAYDDPEGVTARFNLNLVTRINRELGADIPIAMLRHRARWNAELSRVEMHLEALDDLLFHMCGQRFEMRRGETIHTENSHKYTPDQAKLLLQAGGWTQRHLWTDADQDFLILLAQATEHKSAP